MTKKTSRKPRVALVYDRINKWGGAERILLLLHDIFPEAPVYTSVYDPSTAVWAHDLHIKTSFLEKIPFARRHHEFFALFMPFAFEQFDFRRFDYVISLTSEGAKGIVTGSKTKHICICLTPTRYLWSGYDMYFKNKIFRYVTYPLVWYLRRWDETAAARPDVFISISKTVQERVNKYYKRDSEIVFPPLFLRVPKLKKRSEGYFLVVSRLSQFTPHKRVELAIKAANKLKFQLKVVGEGDTSYLKSIAGDTVEIVGKVDDTTLSDYYARSKALIFPGIEDFGLVMVEAQAYGKPVIAYRDGGATEIIIEGKTGEFFDTPSVISLVNALKKFNNKRYNTKDCIENSKRFNKNKFISAIKKHIL